MSWGIRCKIQCHILGFHTINNHSETFVIEDIDMFIYNYVQGDGFVNSEGLKELDGILSKKYAKENDGSIEINTIKGKLVKIVDIRNKYYEERLSFINAERKSRDETLLTMSDLIKMHPDKK